MAPENPVGNDHDVVQRAPVGEREIDNQWVDAHYPRIHRAAWLMTGDAWEAEDLAQETFVVAIDRWNQFEGRSSDSTWLYGILIRLVQRRGRSLARMRRRLQRYVERNGLFPIGEVPTDDPQSKLAKEQWRQSVWADVARLPSPQCVAVTLRFAEEMSYEQIAETVGCATGTAKTRVYHGLRRLRQIVGSESQADQSSADDPSRSPADVKTNLNTQPKIEPSIHVASRS